MFSHFFLYIWEQPSKKFNETSPNPITLNDTKQRERLKSDIMKNIESENLFQKVFIEQKDDALNSRRVHHDTDTSAHGLRRQVLGELGPDGSSVAVGSGDLAPDDAEVRLLRLVGD